MNGTEKMKLPCGHRFDMRSLYDLFNAKPDIYKRGGFGGAQCADKAYIEL